MLTNQKKLFIYLLSVSPSHFPFGKLSAHNNVSPLFRLFDVHRKVLTALQTVIR